MVITFKQDQAEPLQLFIIYLLLEHCAIASHFSEMYSLSGWVLNDYGRFSSVSLMLDQLKRPTLQIRRKLSRLQTLHKIHYQQLSLQIPHYYLPKTRPTRQYHHLHYILPTSSTTAYQNSYFSRTINEWNILPTDTIEIADTDLFTARLQSYYCT